MKYAWLTDPHLNFLEPEERQEFYNKLKKMSVDGLFISGDIAEATSIVEIMDEMINALNKNIYFVLGNHDYYFDNVENVRAIMRAETINNAKCNWLPVTGPISLSQEVMLIGQDGWADGRLGNYINSRIVLRDSSLIEDLFDKRMLGKLALLDKMQQLADEDAKCLSDNIVQAWGRNPKKIIILTHVPPFKESCLHKGEISNDDWLPFFTSKVIGEVLLKYAGEHANIEFLVLCGHTHSEAFYQPLSNLTVRAGVSEYYFPCASDVIEIE